MSSRTHPVANLFPLLLVGLLAGVSFWLEQTSRPAIEGGDGRGRHDPDYVIEGFQFRRFDETGALQHTLWGEHLRHYPDDDSTIVLAPRITYHRDPPTSVSAREARLDSGAKHVELVDDVQVVRGGRAGKPDTVLTTQRLDAYPDDELATSSVPVTIAQGQSNINGSGMSANNKTSIYVLEGPVRGIFFRKGTGATAPPVESSPAAVVEKPAAKPPAKPAPKKKSASKSKPQPKAAR